MGNFQGGGNRGGGGGFRGGNGGGRPDFKKKSWGGNDRGGDRGEVSMHKATCSDCGKGCEVPFRPTGDKPVYCSDCFGSKRDGGDRGGRKDFGNRGPKRESSFDRPAPRQEFSRPTLTPPGSAEVTKQLSEISMKLDRLTNAITRMTEVKEVAPTASASHSSSKMESKKSPVKAVAKKSAPVKSASKKVVSKKKK